ncbi:MAG: glycoside hydrolase family 140 protein [Anaerolineae bacterium]|nr:glycoside hydrolase family 140 protein [Anaerolineae bacterium]
MSRDGRRIERADGTPFFYLGDTAWQLFHRLDREEADRYLENRAQKGFTVIQCVVLAELGGLDVPNAYGDLPLVDRDSARPNEGYMRHVDYVVDCAQALGLTVAMLPTWGSHWKRVGAAGPYLFDRENARAFGRIVGCRYREKPVIWVLGGDQDVESDAERAIIEAMAEGLDEGDGGRHLMTYHPRGPGRSSDVFHAAPWLDVNMIQSSHGAHDHDNGLFVEHDYGLEPPKPTLDGEPRYETLPVGFYHRDVSRLDRFDAYDVRQAAYWALLAGACGHTYGNNSVWQMWAPGRKPVLWADIPWWEALDHPGAAQMGLLRRLFESYAWHKLVPAPSAIVAGPQAPGARVRAACATDGSFLFAYSPRGEPFALDRRVLEARRVRETWFDPRYGSSHWVHTGTSVGVQTYAPPTSGRGNDWVLILEDAEGARAEPALGGDPGPGG